MNRTWIVFFIAIGLAACATDGDASKVNTSALTAIDQCNDRCIGAGVEAERCAESCAELGGKGCYDDCLTRGGDEMRCRQSCDGSDCHSGCMEAGDDEGLCRERCANQGVGAACHDGCMEKVGDETLCEERCAGIGGAAVEPCTEGEEVEREGDVFVCTDGDWVPKAG